MNNRVADAASPRPTIGRPFWALERTHEELSPVSSLMKLMEARWEEWMADGACVDASDPDAWFPGKGAPGPEQDLAIRICGGCPVREKCLEYAMRHVNLPGIWGGMSERHRRKAIRRAAG